MRRFALPGVATVAGALTTAAIFHRTILLTRFDHVIGDYGDTRFVLAVLEHWFRMSTGQDRWLGFNFFYPASDALGYSEALFLMASPYMVARLAGLPAFGAFQLTLVVTTLIGFAGMMLFLSGLLRLALPIALAGSAVFAGSSILYQTLTNGHTQLQTSLWVPYFACLVLLYLRSFGVPSSRRMLFGGGGAVMAAALLYTSFPIGWFVLLQLLVVTGVLLAGEVWRQGGWVVALRAWAWLARGWRHLLALAALLTGSLLPFLTTYMPILRQRGGRPYQDLIDTLPHPSDLLHPAGNWAWDDHMIAAYWPSLAVRGRELGKGLPWVLLALFVATMLWLVARSTGTPAAALPDREAALQRRVGSVLGISVLICWALMIQVGSFSLWRLVYIMVPGAVGVRAVFRFNVVLVFSVITVAAIGLHAAWTAALRQTGIRAVTMLGGTLLLGLFITAEEINSWSIGTSELSRSRHFALIDAMPATPAGCRVFALLPEPADPSWPAWAQQLDAIMLAQARNLPTVNGYSGQSPLHWDLGDTSSPLYPRHLIDWVGRHGLWPGLCGVDLKAHQWLPLTQSDLLQRMSPVLTPGAALDFLRAGNTEIYLADGWSSRGEQGIRPDGSQSRSTA